MDSRARNAQSVSGMIARKRIAVVAGMLIVTAFSFGKGPELGPLARLLLDQPWFPPPLISEIVKSVLAGSLAIVGFGIARRQPAFYGMRRIAKPDFFATLKTLAALLATVIVLRSVQAYLLPSVPDAGGPDVEDLPLVYGLVAAGLAGLTEGFVYRGYLIEELGALTGRRPLAAAVSVLAFGLAHVGSGYGWSIELVYPVLYGLAITILYLWRGNLWACVLLHAGLDALYAIAHAT